MLKELREIASDKSSGVSVVLNDEGNYRRMVGTIPGKSRLPRRLSYEGKSTVTDNRHLCLS